jgi:hypothetical protein
MTDYKKEEMQNYLKNIANPILEELMTEIILKMPKQKDLPKFCITWFQKLEDKSKDDELTSDSEDE